MNNINDFEIKDKTLIKYKGHDKNVIIPEGVTSIGTFFGDGAFEGCSNLTSITIPDSVTSIGSGTFCNCWGLKSINIPNGVTEIESHTFLNCRNLTSITIPDGVTSIGHWAFEGCSNLTSINIPDSVTFIGIDAFKNCKNLKITITSKDSANIGDYDSKNLSNLACIRIPDGVKSIGDRAFSGFTILEYITIPESVTSIGDSAFENCYNLTSINIPESVTSIGNKAFKSCHNLKSITIPGSVTSIGDEAFKGCWGLKSVNIPGSVTSIGDEAFKDCWSLKSVNIPENLSSIGKEVFYGCDKLTKYNFVTKLPECFYPYVGDIYPQFTDNQLKQYVLNETVWPRLDSKLQTNIFINRHGETLIPAYKKCVDNADALGESILKHFSGKPSNEAYNVIETFQTTFPKKASTETLEQSNSALNLSKPSDTYYELESIVMKNVKDKKDPISYIKSKLKDYYSLDYSDLPELIDIEGKPVPKLIMAYLLTYYKDAEKILKLLNQESFQNALEDLADKNLGYGNGRRMYLAGPICRYANESLMEGLTRWAPKWASHTSGKNTPCLYEFRQAVLHSETKSAMLFADKYGDLDEYARIRHTDADTIRNQFLSDVGLDEKGGKTYDLGNQIVTARLQNDFSFLFELPNGKIAKSLPKKGADSDKYASATADFSEMKKSSKKIVKNQASVLFSDFLNGRSIKADTWKNSYLKNPLLRRVASLLVWAQGSNTFILTETGAVNVEGKTYTIGSTEIALAHPMEMTGNDLTAWQKYFSTNHLKQPFEQIWEPVVDAKSVKKDRYKGMMIPYYRFLNKEKHGIQVVDKDYHNMISITFNDCDADVCRVDYSRHYIDMNDRFEIEKITPRPFTRKTNHIIAYLDRVTIYDRIRKDDTSIVDILSQFTLAQITDFIKVATESNSTNVIAMLLDYKNKNFADFDPMEEFSLDF